MISINIKNSMGEKKYEFTKKELERAFKIWNADAIDSGIAEVGDFPDGCEVNQAQYIIKYLKEIQGE